MQLIPYLNFNGQCAEAFRFYGQCLGGKIVMLVGDGVLMASDSPPEYYERPQGTYVSLQLDKLADADRIFHALADKGTVKMPIQQTFWALRFGMVVDRFGTPWMINCEQGA